MDIKELIIREWGQLLDYQQAREQVRNASSKIETLEMMLDQNEEDGKKMVFALEHLTDADLQVIKVNNKREQLKNAHRLIRKVELVKKTRIMNDDLARQCR